MTDYLRSDITGGLIVGAAAFTLFAVAALAFKHVLRNFTVRKEPTVGSPFDPFAGREKFAGLATASSIDSTPSPVPAASFTPAPASALSGDRDSGVSPFDDSEATPFNTMLAAEALLREEWLSPEEDEAWQHM